MPACPPWALAQINEPYEDRKVPEYYHFDIARGEGEGGASDATVAFSKATRLRARGRKKR